MQRRWGRWSAFAVVLAAAVGGSWWLARPEPVEATLVEVVPGTVEALVANTRGGTVNACRRARLAPATGGTIELLAAREGAVAYVEAHNARAYRDANPLAAAFAQRHELPGVASSDAHSIIELGVATTVLPGAFSTAQEFLALLPQAEITPGRASYYVRLWTPLAKLVNRVQGNGRIRPERVEDPA